MAKTAQKSKPARASLESPQFKSFGTVLHGLQFKWTTLLTLLMFSLAFAGDALLQKQIAKLMLDQQKTQAHKLSFALATAATPKLLDQNTAGLQDMMRNYLSEKSMLYVEFFSNSGKRLLSHGFDKTIKPEPLDKKSDWNRLAGQTRLAGQADGSPARLELIEKISTNSNGENPIGYIRVGFDLTETQTQVTQFLQQVRYAEFLAILAMIPLAFIVVRRVTQPIESLGRTVRQFAGGDFRVRSDIRRSDEIGQLSQAFNTMADELSESNDNLVKLNAELEDRVLQRTRQLKELASRDPLTGLYNRRHFNEVLVRRFAEAERYNTDISCLMIDLDNFKKVNDKFGHEMGDTLLTLTANVITAELRGADVGARFGGDEFCILLPQTSPEQAQSVGQRIVKRFEAEVKAQLPEHGSTFGMSVGVAGLQQLKLVHHDELMKAADQALYDAKQAGKNRVHLASALV